MQGPFRKNVAKTLQKCLDSSLKADPRFGASPGAKTSPSKRKRPRMPDGECNTGGGPATEAADSADEREAVEHEAAMEAHRHNLLNRSMQVGYKKQRLAAEGQQSEREDAALSPKGKVAKGPRKGSGPNSSPRPAEEGVSGPGGGGRGISLSERPIARYSDLGGIEDLLQEVKELIEWPLTHPEVYEHLGIAPPRGILLHGPPGCGKTLLANAIAGELGVAFISISAPEIVSGVSGESEQKVGVGAVSLQTTSMP